MHKTLIDPSTLAAKLGDPDWIVIDCRFDLTNPAKGEELYREAHIPGASYAHLDRHLSGTKTGKNGRHPLPDSDVITATSAISGSRRDAGRGLRRRQRHVCERGCGGCCGGWDTMRSRCSMAASRDGSVKDIRVRGGVEIVDDRATSRARRVRAGA